MNNNIKQIKTVFTVEGRTNNYKFVSSNYGTKEFAIDHFKSKYPRFNGNAHLISISVECVGGLIRYYNHDSKISHFEFKTTKELINKG